MENGGFAEGVEGEPKGAVSLRSRKAPLFALGSPRIFAGRCITLRS